MPSALSKKSALETNDISHLQFQNHSNGAVAEESDGEWTIGEMAAHFNLTLRALRFYESKGLLSPRRFGATRYYGAKDRSRLSLVLDAKRMGFTLSEAAEMIGKNASAKASALPLTHDRLKTQISFLENQKASIEDALAQLRNRLVGAKDNSS